MEEIYVDSNIFIYASLDEEKSDAARDVLNDIASGDIQGWTSALTYDEVCWQLLNALPRDKAEEAMELMLNVPNLGFITTTTRIIQRSHSFVFNRGADPRDAIHLASMEDKAVNTIITEDDDFATHNVTRMGLAGYSKPSNNE